MSAVVADAGLAQLIRCSSASPDSKFVFSTERRARAVNDDLPVPMCVGKETNALSWVRSMLDLCIRHVRAKFVDHAVVVRRVLEVESLERLQSEQRRQIRRRRAVQVE